MHLLFLPVDMKQLLEIHKLHKLGSNLRAALYLCFERLNIKFRDIIRETVAKKGLQK